MVRGDPVCRKEDCSQYDVGLVFKEISSYSDQDKLKFIENVWKPGELFDFPASVECSNSNRHFVWSWLKRFPWLAYSKYLDGAFCLPCVFFGVQCGRNTNKLDKTRPNTQAGNVRCTILQWLQWRIFWEIWEEKRYQLISRSTTYFNSKSIEIAKFWNPFLKQ